MEQTTRENLKKIKKEIDKTDFKNQLNDLLNPIALDNVGILKDVNGNYNLSQIYNYLNKEFEEYKKGLNKDTVNVDNRDYLMMNVNFNSPRTFVESTKKSLTQSTIYREIYDSPTVLMIIDDGEEVEIVNTQENIANAIITTQNRYGDSIDLQFKTPDIYSDGELIRDGFYFMNTMGCFIDKQACNQWYKTFLPIINNAQQNIGNDCNFRMVYDGKEYIAGSDTEENIKEVVKDDSIKNVSFKDSLFNINLVQE